MSNILNYDLVIVGGGATGMSAAVSAYLNGVSSLCIIEKEDVLGGILEQCIHNGFGLHTYKEELTGPEYAKRKELEVLKYNITTYLSSFVTKVTKNNDAFNVVMQNKHGVFNIITKSIIFSTGCYERNRGAINIEGDRPSGVMTAGLAQKYINIEGYMVGKKVFILGSGDIGLIMARRMRLEGAEVLGVAELMPYSNGLNRNIVQCLNDYNIPLYLSTTVKAVNGKDRLESITLVKVDDNLNYIEGSEFIIECDTLLLSVGLIPSNDILSSMGALMHPRTKGAIVDESFQTSIKGIFACGNSLHVHDLVDYASIEGEQAGYFASLYLKGNLDNSSYIDVSAGSGVSYTMPSHININNVDKVKISFRVTKPHKSCFINVINKYTSEVIKTLKKPYLLPAEMENIMIDKSLINTILSNIIVEVKDA